MARRKKTSEPIVIPELRDAPNPGLSALQLKMIAGTAAFPSPSGTVVNQRTCLSVTAVWHAVNLYASTIGKLSQGFHCYQRLGDGGKKPAPKHAAERSINCWDHKITNRQKFWQAILVNKKTTGNAYAEIQRLPNGDPSFLLIHVSTNVKLRQKDNGDLYYRLDHEGRDIQAENMLHFAEMGISGVEGFSPIQSHSIAIGNAIAVQEYINNFYGNNAQPAGLLKSTAKIREEDEKRARETFTAINGGVGNAGKFAILGPGWEYEQLGLSPVDTALIDQLNYSVADIARIYGVPLSLMNVDTTQESNASNVEHNRQWYTLGLGNELESIQAECEKKLFKPKDQGKFFVEFDLSTFLKTDDAARGAFYKTLFDMGAITPNQIIMAEGGNPYEGGDTYWIEANNYAPVSKVLAAPVETEGDGDQPADQPGDVKPDQGDEKPVEDRALYLAVEPVIYAETGRLVRRGLRAGKTPEKLHELRTHALDVLGPYAQLAATINPETTLDRLADLVVSAVETIETPDQIGDVIRSITRTALIRGEREHGRAA